MPPLPDIVAVACVLDSSLTLAEDWPHLFQDYVSPLLTRLHEVHSPQRSIRLGLVCYAPSSTIPNPLLSRIFFGPPAVALTSLSKDSASIGLGSTGSAAGRGMAVLDGLVATIELFDQMKEAYSQTICHAIHLAACVPDSAERPMWNASPTVDQITWDSLPAEMRKRDINYSLIQVRPIPKLNDLFTSVAATSSQNAWFNVRPHHTVRLMGYPPPQKIQNVKRPGEPVTSPESKRQRLSSQPNQASPKVANSPAAAPARTPSQSAEVTRPPQVTPQPSAPSNAHPSTSPSAPASQLVPPAPAPEASPKMQLPSTSATAPPAAAQPAQPPQPPQPSRPPVAPVPNVTALQKAAEKIRSMEADVAMKTQLAKAAEAAGNIEEAEKMREWCRGMQGTLLKSKAVVQQSWNRLKASQQQGAQGAQGGQQVPGGSSAGSGDPSATPTLAPAPASAPAPATVPAPAPPVPQQSPSLSNTTPSSSSKNLTQAALPPPSNPPSTSAGPPSLPQMPMIPPNASPEMAQQMQKLVEQRNASNMVGARSFNCTLTWKGSTSGTHSRVEMHASVKMTFPESTSPVNTLSWPALMALTPSKDPAASIQVLQEWIKRHSCLVFPINALSAPNVDPKLNEESYRSLLRLLMEKNLYALVPWTGPDGHIANRILIFVINQRLAGAYFPGPGGVPELPRGPAFNAPPEALSASPSHVNPQPGMPAAQPRILDLISKLPQEVQAQLRQLPPDQQRAWLAQAFAAHQNKMKQQQQQKQQQLQQQQQQNAMNFMHNQAAGPSQLSGFSPVPTAAMFPGRSAPPQGMPQGIPQQMLPPEMMNFTQQQMNAGMMHRRTPSGGAGNGVNFDINMMQSFMQRNQDGNPGM